MKVYAIRAALKVGNETARNDSRVFYDRFIVLFTRNECLVVTATSLWLVDRLRGPGHPGAEIVALTAANLGVTVGRFLAMRLWIFRHSSEVGTQTIGHIPTDPVAHVLSPQKH